MSGNLSIFFPVAHLIEMGGPVIAVLIAVSILVLSLCLYKLWQFHSSQIGQHKAIKTAVAHWDAGAQGKARDTLHTTRHYLGPIILLGMSVTHQPGALQRLEADTEQALAPLERGLRTLDNTVQLAPLLGLFGTVIGMIEAFRALQGAGAQVDPSILAGGIWVALLTTAAGLAVAMPTSVALSWFEAQIDAERMLAEKAFATILTPASAQDDATPARELSAHVA